MKSIQRIAELAGGLAICAALTVCSGPGAAATTAYSSALIAAVPSTLTMSVPQTASRAGYVPESANAADEATCDAFRQMVEGIDTLSTEEQQQLVIEMVDAVEQSESPDLTQAVIDFGRGWLDGNPEQFPKGMRALSRICSVPYE
jgi:hypothetical protein